jgi:hypothetical protein
MLSPSNSNAAMSFIPVMNAMKKQLVIKPSGGRGLRGMKKPSSVVDANML